MNIDIPEIQSAIPVIDSSADYWLIRANGGKYYTDFLINNYVGLGWNDITTSMIKDARNNSTIIKQQLKESIRNKGDDPDDNSETTYGTWAGQLIRFIESLKLNDIVVVPSESSEQFLVGKIISDAYEASNTEIGTDSKESNYQKSDYKKRRKIQWLGNFNRNEADTALYKMIYSQHTLSDINIYKSYINRAMFDAYIEDNELHLTFKVTQSDGVNSEYLGLFMYQISQLAKKFDQSSEVIVRVNVQSPGPIETVFKSATIGICVFATIALVTAVPYGGNFEVGNPLLGNIKYSVPGIATQHEKNVRENEKAKEESEKNEDEHNERLLKLEKEAVNQAVDAKAPISQLGLKLPSSVQHSLQEQVDRKLKEQQKKSPDNNQGQDSTQQNSNQ